MLDAFCYSGGFGLHAAKGGATTVECVDASESALSLARQNAGINGLENIEFVRADVFRHLDVLSQAGRRYDMIILDPPKFAAIAQLHSRGITRLSPAHNAGSSPAESGWDSGDVLLFRADYSRDVGRADGTNCRRRKARFANPGQARCSAGSSDFGNVSGVGIFEVLCVPGDLTVG